MVARVNTGSQTKELRLMWTDDSIGTDFLEDAQVTGLMKVNLRYNLILSQAAQRALLLSKQTMFANNHSDVQVNSRYQSHDVCHDFNESQTVPGIDGERKMIVIAGQRPWYAQRRYHLLSALFGVNWRVRDLLDERSSYVQFTFEKQIQDIEL